MKNNNPYNNNKSLHHMMRLLSYLKRNLRKIKKRKKEKRKDKPQIVMMTNSIMAMNTEMN